MKNEVYESFVKKFKPKLTTDDCATPPAIYDVVLKWVCKEYGVDSNRVIRPFWPGADYQSVEYPDGHVVVDNPPFSILSKICEWYLDKGIKFFLFSPTLTTFSAKTCMKVNHIICGAEIVYDNGAKVNTSFITNLGNEEIVAQSAKELSCDIERVVKAIKKERVKTLPKYDYPYEIVTASMIDKYSRYGVDFCIKRSECVQVSALDDQRKHKKSDIWKRVAIVIESNRKTQNSKSGIFKKSRRKKT